jgi:hypothetical protein
MVKPTHDVTSTVDRADQTRPPAVVVDLARRRRRKDIRRLRRGEGKLMAEVEALIDRLIAAKTIDAAAQPVVLVVRERPPKRKDWWC